MSKAVQGISLNARNRWFVKADTMEAITDLGTDTPESHGLDRSSCVFAESREAAFRKM